MNFLKKFGVVSLIALICLVISGLLTYLIRSSQGILYNEKGEFDIIQFICWVAFIFVFLVLLCNVFISHRIAQGKAQEVLFFLSISILMSLLVGYIVYVLIKAEFDFSKMDWLGFFTLIINFDLKYYLIVGIILFLFIVVYSTMIDRRILDFMGKGGLKGDGSLKQINSNLENSRWMTNQERDKQFKKYKYSTLSTIKKDGIPVFAKMYSSNTDMEVSFSSPCHALVIGSTGSGKTTTFVSPMIQLIGATAAGSSMIVTDPKGELFSLHSKFLTSRGYDVKVIDLRDTYSSYRWNPLDSIWDQYEKYRNASKAVEEKSGKPNENIRLVGGSAEEFEALEKWFLFEGKAYKAKDSLDNAVLVYKKKIYDEVYEDLNDLISVLIPIENEKDPMWEKGARSITLAVVLAMLEDSENEENGMIKEKFNFFNMAKILQNSSNDYEGLKAYFAPRSALSKAKSLSKQVCDAATQTRASYMSIVYEKLTMFNDAGICALTSASDFTSEQLAYKPTALFLKIPDEKDTRHNLAAIFILNIYKTLIKVASAKEDLSLDRNVFFIMDEFGNMPKIEKFDKFITVGRSRKIWFTMIIQSYAQLNNVYGDTVADIVKGNCGIKMFIGSNDMNTCKEYSELCGNITVVTQSSSSSVHSKEISYSQQTQVRPLIYPSELQRLNAPGDIGHSIIVTFGNYPLQTYFTPSFKVPLYKIGKMDTGELTERIFDDAAVFYDITKVTRFIDVESGMQEVEENQEQIENEEQNVNSYNTESSYNIESLYNTEDSQNVSDRQESSQEEPRLSKQEILNMIREFESIYPDATLDSLYDAIAEDAGGEKE